MENIKIPDWVVDEKTLYRFITTYCNECPKYTYCSGADSAKCQEIKNKVVEKWENLKCRIGL